MRVVVRRLQRGVALRVARRAREHRGARRAGRGHGHQRGRAGGHAEQRERHASRHGWRARLLRVLGAARQPGTTPRRGACAAGAQRGGGPWRAGGQTGQLQYGSTPAAFRRRTYGRPMAAQRTHRVLCDALGSSMRRSGCRAGVGSGAPGGSTQTTGEHPEAAQPLRGLVALPAWRCRDAAARASTAHRYVRPLRVRPAD